MPRNPRARRDYAKLRRALLTPLAETHGLDYDIESTLSSSEEPVQVAYRLVAVGAGVPLSLINPDEIPTDRRRIRAQTARAVRRSIASDRGRRAAVLGTNAIGSLMAQTQARLGDSEQAAIHLGALDLVSDVFPSAPEDVACAQSLCDEYRTLDDHYVREGVRSGRERGGAYHEALMAGGNPDRDPGLVRMQQDHAADYLRKWGVLHCLRIVVGDEMFDGLREDLWIPGSLNGSLEWNVALADSFLFWASGWIDAISGPT